MEEIRQDLAKQEGRLIGELLDFLRIPSISAEPAYRHEVDRAADFVCAQLENCGAAKVRKEVVDGGHPIVLAEKIPDPSLPTVLVYGHYDVQPPDPLELWHSPPFAPEIRDGLIYARGASDDKSQMFAHLKAIEYLEKKNIPTCNLKFVFEGEEECGSTALSEFVRLHKEELKADVAVISDTAMLPGNRPAITVGLRGICTFEIEVQGANRDLHSGIYGGAVVNPAIVLSRMLGALLDEHSRITVPGLYDSVQIQSRQERQAMEQAMDPGDTFTDAIGIESCQVEEGYSPLECSTIRPSLDINGLAGGYAGEGFKTVLPATARAKLSLRLVPHQKAAAVNALVEKYLRQLAPETVRVTVRVGHGADPVYVPADFPAFKLACEAMRQTFGLAAASIRGGGSIPVVALFQSELGLKPILMGFGQDADAIHSPNEHFGLRNYFQAIEAVVRFYALMGERH